MAPAEAGNWTPGQALNSRMNDETHAIFSPAKFEISWKSGEPRLIFPRLLPYPVS